jgi:protocatechuate 3,4-dioxygenase beta subunit
MTRQIDRRQALAAIGSVSLAALLAACGASDDSGGATTEADVSTAEGGTATVQPQTSGTAAADLFADAPACAVTVEETEGPYYFDADSIRSDIREDREGATLRLALRVRDAAACTPLGNAVVDIWHCDAAGLYSGFESASNGGGQPGSGSGPTDDETYLRGAQVTNADGIVEFVTIYPGWYRGRTVHIHAKVHLDNATVLTTQLFFDDEFTAAVYEREPYVQDSDRDTFNDTDNIFDESLLLKVSEEGDGYLGVMSFDVMSA